MPNWRQLAQKRVDEAWRKDAQSRLAATLRYSDDQPRDDYGKWTSHGRVLIWQNLRYCRAGMLCGCMASVPALVGVGLDGRKTAQQPSGTSARNSR